jgi:DNA-directed RNA polymerase specialized sigma24 family protein
MQGAWYQSIAYGVQAELKKILQENRVEHKSSHKDVVRPKDSCQKNPTEVDHASPETAAIPAVRNHADPFHMEYDGSDTNFWHFYVKNQKAVDAIMQACIDCYSRRIDVKDAKQDILMRLYRCNVLSRFNPARSKLNTWLTVTIGRYMQSLLRANDKKPYWDPWPTQHLDNTKHRHSSEQVMVQTLNGLSENKRNEVEFFGRRMTSSNSLPWELADEDGGDIDERITSQELVQLIKKRVSPELAKTVDLLCSGYSSSDISRIMATSSLFGSSKMIKIKEVGKRVCKQLK